MLRKLVFVIFIALILLGGYFAWNLWLRPGGGDAVMVQIPEGASFDAILDSLEGAGLVDSRLAFRMLAVSNGDDARIRPGTYKFQREIAGAELLRALVEGRSTVKVKITFPEGITIRRIASLAQSLAGTDSAMFVKLANDREFLKSIGINAPSGEGYLMPDTYFINWGEKPDALLRRMVTLFLNFYTDSLKTRAARQNLTPYEAVTLASIVEGEARVDEERPVIAGLYLNRLRRGIKLQADPTIQYVLPGGPRRLFFSDYKLASPYNTYEHKGLPPTPINNPSRASILAVLDPASHDYIFMVAKEDGTGRHTFTRTDREHVAATREAHARRDAK